MGGLSRESDACVRTRESNLQISGAVGGGKETCISPRLPNVCIKCLQGISMAVMTTIFMLLHN